MNRNRPLSTIQNFIQYPEKYLNKRALFSYQRKFLAKVLPPTLACDEFYMKFTYRKFFGKKLDLTNPSTFNEKIRWMILYDRNPLYAVLADKLLVREHVSNKIGQKYLKPLIGCYNDTNELDWESLPEKFAIKLAHGSHWNFICEDKRKVVKKVLFKKITLWQSKNFYNVHREWQYKDIQPKILVEEFIEPKSDATNLELNLYCFSGEPIFLEANVSINNLPYRTYFNSNWEKQPFTVRYGDPPSQIEKPKKLDEMIMIAKQLSCGIPFCRVDLSYFDQIILFGELTLTPGAGYLEFRPIEYDQVFGNLIKLRV